jgi:Xaa-Pro aminopeptidase
MWIVFDRENNPDPFHDELGGGFSSSGAAFMFHDNGGPVAEKTYFGSNEQPLDSAIERFYDQTFYYDGDMEELNRRLHEEVNQRNPEKIAINVSESMASGDGLTVSLRDHLVKALGPRLSARMVSAANVAHEFRSRRVTTETSLYRQLQKWTSQWQMNVLSSDIEPSETTVFDLVSRMEDQAAQLGLRLVMDHGRFPLIVWFGNFDGMPGLGRFDSGRELVERGMPWKDARDFPLEPGDLITLDGGLRFLGFSSDMKRSAYLLRPDESEPPALLQEAWNKMLDVSETYARVLEPGLTGREVWENLAADLVFCGYHMEGMEPPDAGPIDWQASFYGHAVGNVVHDVGTRVAAGAVQTGLPLIEDEWVSVEFHLTSPIDVSVGRRWLVRFEQTGQVRSKGFEWLVPRQKELLLIPAH